MRIMIFLIDLNTKEIFLPRSRATAMAVDVNAMIEEFKDFKSPYRINSNRMFIGSINGHGDLGVTEELVCGDMAKWRIANECSLKVSRAAQDFNQLTYRIFTELSKWREQFTCRDKEVDFFDGQDHLFHNCTLKVREDAILITNQAYYKCKGIIKVTMGDSVTDIKQAAFQDCARLCEVQLSENLINICGAAFRSCPIDKITLPDSLRFIGEQAFYNTPLKQIVIPENVTFIGANAFSNRLERAVIKSRDICIHKDAFNDSTRIIHPEKA